MIEFTAIPICHSDLVGGGKTTLYVSMCKEKWWERDAYAGATGVTPSRSGVYALDLRFISTAALYFDSSCKPPLLKVSWVQVFSQHLSRMAQSDPSIIKNASASTSKVSVTKIVYVKALKIGVGQN